jgi:hypothetical protein
MERVIIFAPRKQLNVIVWWGFFVSRSGFRKVLDTGNFELFYAMYRAGVIFRRSSLKY